MNGSAMTAAWPSWRPDDLGPHSVTYLDLPGGVRGVVAVDNLLLGPAIGGLRMTPDVTPGEVLRLARAMTLKNAAVGLPHGGAKAGIAAPDGLSPGRREALIRAFAVAIRDLTDYWPGPDMGTDETAMAWVYDEIGRAVGRPSALGGIPLDTLGATGFGLAVCTEVLQDADLLTIGRARVAVQGFGAVGRNVALSMHRRGATVVAVSERDGAVLNPDGLDVPKLADHQRGGQPLAEFPGGHALPRDDLLALDCDILVPATDAAERLLHERGVLVVPDIIANAGGVICAAGEAKGYTPSQAFADIAERMRTSTAAWLGRMQAGLTPREAALELARERLRDAASYRRSFAA